MALERGEIERAEADVSDVLELAKERNDVAYLPAFLAAMGRVRLARGDRDGAHDRLDEAIDRLRALEFTEKSLVSREARKLATALEVPLEFGPGQVET
jgi:hypothetical protein